MIGTGSNPNVAAVIVIGIEPKWTKRIVDGIAKTGKPVEGFHIERTGDIGTVMKASKKAQEFAEKACDSLQDYQEHAIQLHSLAKFTINRTH